MGELHDTLAPDGGPSRAARSLGSRRIGLLALLAAILSGCGLVAPSGAGPVPSPGCPASTSGPSEPPATCGDGPASPSTGVPAAPSRAAIDPAARRLVWLVDRSGHPGIWTTDLAGGDVRAYVDGPDNAADTLLHDARLVGEHVVLIREGRAAGNAELWILSQDAPPRILLDAVQGFVVSSDEEVLAVRDDAGSRAIWRVPMSGSAPAVVAAFAQPAEGPELGPFGFAVSPDGRTVAAGWVGGPLHIMGPAPAAFDDLGAPLVVDDTGRLIAVTGRAGEAYLVDGQRLVDLAPPDSDPVAVPRSGLVAWPSVGDAGALAAVEVRDLLSGIRETYPAHGNATDVTDLDAEYVVLEATAFDPLHRSLGVVDRRSGRFETFEAAAPPG